MLVTMVEESPLEQVAEIYRTFDSAEIERLQTYVDDVETLTRDEFLRAIHMLSQVYWVGRNVVKPILATPSLVPAFSREAHKIAARDG